jgi:hypothetical protein
MTAANEQQTIADAEVFVDLVLADDDLMRAEFDALMAACWESPSEPPRCKPSPPSGGWAGRPPHRWPPWHRSILIGTVPARRPRSRQRGPPPEPTR